MGEEVFRRDHLGKVDHTIEIARILQPEMIRLLAAQTTRRATVGDSVAYLNPKWSWARRYSAGTTSGKSITPLKLPGSCNPK